MSGMEPRAGIQELYCHHCGHYILFETKRENNGNLLIPCRCGIDHKRFVVNGRVTKDRWGGNNDLFERMKAKRRRNGAFDKVTRFLSYDESLRKSWRDE